MATAILAKDRGLTVFSTTRQPDLVAALHAIGVDHVHLDHGDIAAQTRAILPDGVQAAIELVGTNTLPDTLRATAVHGVVCFTGMLSNQWTVADFYPIDYIPSGVRLIAYGGDAADLPTDVLQAYLDVVAAGRLTVPIDRTYALDQITQAHTDMEHGRATGKLVVLPDAAIPDDHPTSTSGTERPRCSPRWRSPPVTSPPVRCPPPPGVPSLPQAGRPRPPGVVACM
jgi:NADPH2:quinone reductase